MRALRRLLGRLVLALGWAAFFVVAALFVAEQTGILTVVLRRALVERLSPLASDLSVEHVSLDWFVPTIRLQGVGLGNRGDMLFLESASLALDLSAARGLRVDAIEISGGHVRLSRELFDRLQALAEHLPARTPGVRHTAGIPSVTMRDVELDLDTQRLGRLPLGKVDVAVREDPTGGPVLSGRLVPSLSSAPGGSGEIVLSGQEFEPGKFDVLASAAGIPISTDYLPKDTELDDLRPYAPQGVLALSAGGQISLDPRVPPRGDLRLALTQARFVSASGQAFDALSLGFEASYAPKSSEDLWNLAAWTASLRTSGRWRDVPFEGVAQIGRDRDPDHSISCRLHVPTLPCSHDLVDLFGRRPEDENLWAALEPRGQAELWADLECSRDWLPGEPIGPRLGAACEISFTGDAGITYRGFPSGATGKRDQGFPLPLDGLKGSLVYALDSRRARPFVVGLSDLSGSSAKGSIRARGLVGAHRKDLPSSAPGYGFAELDLRIRAEEIPVDASLLAALRGMGGAVPPADTWEPFNPSGGVLSADLRVVRTPGMEYAAAQLALELADLSLSWTGLPVPVSRAHGRLEFASDGVSERGLGAQLDGSLRTAADLSLRLRYQTDPGIPAGPGGKSRIDEIAFLDVASRRVALTGDDAKALLRQFPSIQSAIDPVSPRGFVDLEYSQVRPGPGYRKWIAAEIAPREAELTPQDFKVPAGAVRGRVLVNAVEDSPDAEVRTETILSPLVGVLPGDMQVAVTGAFPPGTLSVHGAGLEPSNPSLLGALGLAIRSSGGAEGSDLSALSVEGALDVEGTIATAGGSTPQGQVLRFFTRENSFQTSKNFRLDRVRGTLELRGDKVLLGHRIRADLAGTTLDLDELRYASTPEGFELTTRLLPVENLPLDRDHLRAFMDESTLDALLGPLGWKGRIDVKSGVVRITGPRNGETRLEFEGEIAPSDMQVLLGVPFSIRSAAASIQQLVFEGGRVRAMCRLQDLYGRIADRELSKANLLITYVEPRLSIESIEGELEGGTIGPPGKKAERSGTAFSIDLEEPFPFQLALDLQGVDLGRLLRGLFVSSFTTHGKLNLQLRLLGDIRRVLGIQGSGSLQVSESRLWSVPVFRALFSQLGLDDKLVFDQMAANIRIKNGVIWTDDISIHSPILELVGNGSIDFDGGLEQDLQVRYALIDRLGPFTRIIYAIQKELLSVAIRGDLGRPRVIFRNPWTRVWAQSDRYRSLPLPSLSPLPSRF